MPIDKITPRQLDADSDGKLISKTSMLDALNLYIGEDDSGNKGVLKNIKGNSIVNVVGDLGDHFFRIIGSVTDSRTGICYLFLFSDNPSYHSVWAYDPEGKLANDGAEVFTLIYRSKQFNFDPQGFVKGDVVYINKQTFTDRGPEFEKDAVIYFTDGKNEPRKINAYRAYQSENNFQIHGDDIYAEADFITACPKTPVDAITFKFERDESRSGSNFKVEPGFQFAYQNVYQDGFESAISCYSDIAFPPTIINQGSSSDVDHSLFNKCVLTIPAQGPEISKIKIVARRGNGPDFFVIDEVNVEPGVDTVYDFYNDRITKGIPSIESVKQFDNLPRRAKAQSVASNRVLYGNYLDGYDNVETSCIASIKYADRPQDFQDFNIGYKPAITRNDVNFSLESGIHYNKSTGFQLDFSSVPDSYSENDTIDISITIAPDRNWHIYRYQQGHTYHSTPHIGAVEQENPDGEDTGFNADVNAENFIDTSTVISSSLFLEYNDYPVFGRKDGIQEAIGSTLYWRTVGGANADTFVECSFGTSGGNPLILKGGPVNFTASFRFTADIASGGRQVVKNAVKAMLSFKRLDIFDNSPLTNYDRVTDEELQAQYLNDLNVEILTRKDQSELNIDLNLPDRLSVAQGRPNVPDDETNPLAKLIVAVKRNGTEVSDPSIQSSTAYPNASRVPVGFFAVEKADVLFDLEGFNVDGEDLQVNFIICAKEINNVELFTCMKGAPNESTSTNLSWAWVRSSKLAELESSSELESPYQYVSEFFGSSFTSSLDDPIDVMGGEDLPSVIGDELITASLPAYNYTRQMGYLDFGEGPDATNAFYANRVELNGTYFNTYSRFSLLDGEGGPGGGRQGSEGTQFPGYYDRASMYNLGSVNSNADPQVTTPQGTPYGWANTVFYRGTILFYFYDTFGGPASTETAITLPLLRFTSADYKYYLDSTYVDHKRLHSFSEITTALFFVNRVNVNDRSFKTSADHDFGIVYFDERGRHGFVNPLATVYVPGYSSLERPGPPGSVSINLKLDHTPPSWAHNYKIVYSKNTSVKEFVQYSAGGAFAKEIEGQQVEESNQNIYVSLNYLQEHPISYSSSFGARGIDGGLSIYKFSEGDKLRVISHDDGGARAYPYNYEFDVVDYRILSDDENNPLSEEPAENQQGAFLVLRNNPFATGFDYTSVAAESSKWGHNCIIEIYSPYKEADEEDRIYYETGKTGKVVILDNQTGPNTLEHDPPTAVIDKGDVWFRKVPVNVREFESGEFVDLIYDDEEVLSEPTPNFKSVYLETMSANDTIPSNSHYIGRPNVYSESAGQVIRESSVTYSDPTDPSSKKPKFSSFNLSRANFKDLSENYGDINHISNFGEYLVVLQRDKISMVPLDRNILSDAAGNQSIISSREVLGDPIFLNEDDGSSSPESVVKIDSTLYFADSNTYQVFKMTKSPGGVMTISDKGVASLIRREIKLKESEDGIVKLIGGYDPLKEEYLLTIISSSNVDLTEAAELVNQLTVTGIVGTDDEETTPDDDTVGSITVFDTDGDGSISVEEIIDQTTLDPALFVEEGEEVITDLNEDGNIDINDFITGLQLNGQNPIEILSAYISNVDDSAAFSDSLVNNLIEGDIIQASDLSVAETSTNTGNIVDPETASISQLVDAIVAKIEQFSDDSPENTLTVGDLQDILETTRITAQPWTLNAAITKVLSDLDGDGLVANPDLLVFLSHVGTSASALDPDEPLIFHTAS